MKYIQVEITRSCNEKCLVCPHRKWKMEGMMDFNDFIKISKFFSSYDLVYLQGWGEPLLHKNFLDMLKIAKNKAKTGFTTNGRKLPKLAESVSIYTDYILVSFAGVECHNELRGVSFDKALDGVKAISEAKKELSTDIRIGVSYMLTTLNAEECKEFVKLVKDAGAEYIAFTNLDYVFDEITDELRLFGKAKKEDEKAIDESINLAKKFKIEVKKYPLRLEEQPVCDANPHLNITLSCECKIYPCIYLCFPFEKIERLFEGKKVFVEKPDFGELNCVKNEYKTFIERYLRRIQAYEKALDSVMISDPFTAIRKISNLNTVLRSFPPPDVCNTCYKLYL